MGVSTNISLPTKISHAGFRTKTVDFIQLNPVLPPPVMPAFEPHPAGKGGRTPASRCGAFGPLERITEAYGLMERFKNGSGDLIKADLDFHLGISPDRLYR